MENLFKNKDLTLAIDAMAKRYGKTPLEVVNLSLYEFNFNFAIMISAEQRLKQLQDIEDTKDKDEEKVEPSEMDKMGISRTVIKIKKENKDGSSETLTTEERS